MASFFSAAGTGNQDGTPNDRLFEAIANAAAASGGKFITEGTVRTIAAAESLSSSAQQELNTSVHNLKTVIGQAVNAAGWQSGSRFGSGNLGEFSRVSRAQEEAAIAAGVMASAPRSALSARVLNKGALAALHSGNKSVTVIGHEGMADALDQRPQFNGRIAAEAYDETDNRNVVAFSVGYNLQSARQDEFAEVHFPTITCAPDSVGFSVSARLFYVEKEVRHAITGAIADFERVNVIKALVKPFLLRNDTTNLVPVVRTGANDSTANFVASTDVAPHAVSVDGNQVTTAPLIVNKKFNLLGLTQTDAMLAAGQLDNTDAIDSSLRLAALYVKLGANGGNKVVKFNTLPLAGSDFNAAVQGNSRLLTLNFASEALKVEATTTDVAGAAISQLSAMADKVVRLSVSLMASVVQDKGDCVLNPTAVEVSSVTDSAGVVLSTASGTGATVAALFAGAAIIGFDLQGHRTNTNRRQRGQLVNVQQVSHNYTVPFLPPITALRPTGDTDANDSDTIQALVTTTRIRTSNGAVTELLAARDVLKAYINSADDTTHTPEILGVARYLVKPQYMEASIDAAADLNSLTSTDRPEDLVSLLINVIRDMAYTLYTGSALQAATEAYSNGAAGKPLLIIGCDPTTARYLTLVGDTRTFGDKFDFKIVSTLDERMRGKITLTFGTEAAYNSGAPHPLHFGCTAWCPEAVVSMPMMRNGQLSHELTVSPRFRHIVNLPIMGYLTVDNISAAMSTKLAINTHTV